MGRRAVVSGRFPCYPAAPTSKALTIGNAEAAEHRKSDRTRAGDLIASALRTLEAEASGITALSAAIHDGLGTHLHRRGGSDLGRARPADRDRHGQVRPCRAQDRGHVRVDGHAGLLRASERSQPWRPRHDHARRRHHGAVVVGRDRRAQGPDRLFAPLRSGSSPSPPSSTARSAAPPTWCWRCRRRARPVRTISPPPPRP